MRNLCVYGDALGSRFSEQTVILLRPTFGIILQIPKLCTYSWRFQILSPPKILYQRLVFCEQVSRVTCNANSAWSEHQKRDGTSSPGAVIKAELRVAGDPPYFNIPIKAPRKLLFGNWCIPFSGHRRSVACRSDRGVGELSLKNLRFLPENLQ